MCSWCWAFAPVFKQLKQDLPEELEVYTLLGGLAPDSDAPMPANMRQQIEQTWHHIENKTKTLFNYQFWVKNTPRRSTYPACRAVITAGNQSDTLADQMIQAIQQAYYLEAKNPSDQSTLVDLATDLGLEAKTFSEDLNSDTTNRLFTEQLKFIQQLGIQGFPSLVLFSEGHYRLISHGYCDLETLKVNLGRAAVF
ncbi:DsbA family protein [Motiliproteus sp. MSK22-1]|uniref:DsbA family protein n=1 Tax=Motiliproteus sp. MSK22-1 TaxID=1897630 RepID=UPI001E60A5C1|nr:DsbA family protein [Motiliproteus sp. MSK22-1]